MRAFELSQNFDSASVDCRPCCVAEIVAVRDAAVAPVAEPMALVADLVAGVRLCVRNLYRILVSLRLSRGGTCANRRLVYHVHHGTAFGL